MEQQACTNCQKQSASVHVLDLVNSSLHKQQHLCQACAEGQGVVPSKQHKTTPMSAEILEDLIGTMTGDKARGRRGAGPVCPACGTSAADFKSRGRFGCARCYETFRASVLPLLERVHDATRHQGRFPAQQIERGLPDSLEDLRRRLEAAIQNENYEEAASLRDRLRTLEQSPPTTQP
ncbi:MAG: UvrB/UvrC motif-containing protein [Planctomycetota bacterium]